MKVVTFSGGNKRCNYFWFQPKKYKSSNVDLFTPLVDFYTQTIIHTPLARARLQLGNCEGTQLKDLYQIIVKFYYPGCAQLWEAI